MVIKFMRRHSIIITSLLLFVIMIGILFIKWLIYIHNHPQPEIYFSTYFEDGISEYESLDATWIPLNNSHKGIVELSSKEYAAPHLMIPLTLEQSPSNSFVCHIRTYISAYTNEAMNIGTLIYPTGSIAIVTNQNDQVGISGDLFAKPYFSDSSVLKRDQWNDIYTYIDMKNSKISVYVNDKVVLSSTFEQTIYPVQEIWLGSIWINGGGRYGAPKNVQFSSVELGNKGLLPKPTFFDFLHNNIFKQYSSKK